jgi:hypothetical protein
VFETLDVNTSETNSGDMVETEATPVLPTMETVSPDSHATATTDFDDTTALRRTELMSTVLRAGYGATASDSVNITSLETTEQLTAVNTNPSNAAVVPVTVESENTGQTAASTFVCDDTVMPIKAFYRKRRMATTKAETRPKRQRKCPIRFQ